MEEWRNIMKTYINKYKFSKYRSFVNGLLFAIVAIVALILCVMSLKDSATSIYVVLFHFSITLLSILMGFIAMFKPYNTNDSHLS